MIDTNVIVSGLLSRSGPPGQILALWQAGGFEAVSCGAHISEVARTLRKPYLRRAITEDELADVITFMVHRSRFVPDGPSERVVPDDPDDDYLVRMAREWDAALVTGDRHLLDLGLPAIMAPTTFLALLGR